MNPEVWAFMTNAERHLFERGRQAGLEEAAKECERHSGKEFQYLAQLIRALSSGGKGGGE